jgi:(1->4)-alpha-D-glucan 1-alpha-D-glucosylmutase
MFHRKIDFFGKLNSLSQVLLKLTCPGVPDLYQGAELWDFSLVDPDNRRPVDYNLRRRFLNLLKENWREDFQPHESQVFFERLFGDHHSQGAKLFLIWRTLNFRRMHEELFRDGKYIPLSVSGTKCEHVCAFARELQDDAVVVIAPRLIFGLTGGVARLPLGKDVWKDTMLEIPDIARGEQYRDVFTGVIVKAPCDGQHSTIAIAEMLRLFPAALLRRER